MRIISLFFFILVLSACEVLVLKPNQEDNPLNLGNPSSATNNTSNENNFLMEKKQYSLSYNKSKSTANWVAWHLSPLWKGYVSRQDNFRPDENLPSNWYRAKTSDYTNSGFDRGHLCPSDDRDGTVEDNSTTFLMSNIIPQAPNHNRTTWKNLEDYCRDLMYEGNELYIIAGVLGEGGIGANGLKNLIANQITVPASLWKVILILPQGGNDLSRIDASTRVITVNMPNTQTVTNKPWGDYRISVDALEALTGFDFFDGLNASLQAQLESEKDNGPTL